MAEASVSMVRDQFSCSICLDLLKDPVTVPCGHSYCMSCISSCWDQEDQKQIYSCPQCRQSFTPRPALGKNTLLAEVVEKLRKTNLQAAPAQYSPGDVECDVCTGDKNKAIKSCLVCLESYCQIHFERHEEFHSKKRHKVTDATEDPQKMVCPKHERLLDIFCRTDQCCICSICSVYDHKDHDTVSVSTEKNEKQRELETRRITNQKKIEGKEEELQCLSDAVEFYMRSTQAAVDEAKRIFTELIHFMERSCSEVTQLIRDQEKTAVCQAEDHMALLKQEMEDLRRRNSELEQLSNTQHDIPFLQRFQSLSSQGSTDTPRAAISARLNFDSICKSMFVLREKLEQFWCEGIEKISGKVRYSTIIPTCKPETNEEFLQYSSPLTLDPNTLNESLLLDEVNKRVDFSPTVQAYLDHPDRFDGFPQVLCRESVSGRSYWEVEWEGWVGISVSYKSISRKGGQVQCEFGRNDQSWSLYCTKISCYFWHNNKRIPLPALKSSTRIGVFVDYEAGTLSFYSVSDSMSLIHRVQTTFTEPLCAGFWVRGTWGAPESKITLCNVVQK